MLVKSQVKYIQSLGHKKFRDADGVFVAEGPKIVNELLEADNLNLVMCFAKSGWLESSKTLMLGREKKFFHVDDNDLERISSLSSPNQVVAVFSKPVFPSLLNNGGITLLLDTIQDPGNLGTIIRTADWFGVRRIICSEDSCDVFSSKVIQSAMGSIIRTALIYTELESYIRQNDHQPLYASSLEGEDLSGMLSVKNAMLLMGNESRGIHPNLSALAARHIRIPGTGGAESLNVAVATGILLSRMSVIS